MFVLVASAVATVGPGAPSPPNDCLCPPILVHSECFFEHCVTTRQQAIMEKGIIIFKHDSRVNFSRLFAKLRPPTALYKCDPIIRLINTPLRMCRGIGMYAYRSVTGILLVIMT